MCSLEDSTSSAKPQSPLGGGLTEPRAEGTKLVVGEQGKKTRHPHFSNQYTDPYVQGVGTCHYVRACVQCTYVGHKFVSVCVGRALCCFIYICAYVCVHACTLACVYGPSLGIQARFCVGAIAYMFVSSSTCRDVYVKLCCVSV